MQQRKALKRGELTLKAMEFNNLRLLGRLEKLSGWSSLRFSRSCRKQRVSRLELWSSGPQPDRGCISMAATCGHPPCPCWQPRFRHTELGSSRFLAPPVRPLTWKVGCGVCLTVTTVVGGGRGEGLRERLITVLRALHLLGAPPRHHCWAGQGWSLAATWCPLKSLSFTFIFQKMFASLLSSPPLPSTSLGLSDWEACTEHPSQRGLLPAAVGLAAYLTQGRPAAQARPAWAAGITSGRLTGKGGPRRTRRWQLRSRCAHQ